MEVREAVATEKAERLLSRAVRGFASSSLAKGWRTWHQQWEAVVEALRIGRATLTRWTLREITRAWNMWEEMATLRMASVAVARRWVMQAMTRMFLIWVHDLKESQKMSGAGCHVAHGCPQSPTHHTSRLPAPLYSHRASRHTALLASRRTLL